MARSVAIFGTPDGFDSLGLGDDALLASEVIRKFEALSFTLLNIPLGTTAWGFFKRSDASGVVIGVAKLVRAHEFSEARPGGYLGAGFVFRNQFAHSAPELISAIQELTEAVATSALGRLSYRFVASRIGDLPLTSVPESCNRLELVDVPRSASFADSSINRLYVSGKATEVLTFLVANHDKFSTINLLFEDSRDLSAPAASAGLKVTTVPEFEKYLLSVEAEIKRRNQAAKQRALEEAARARQMADANGHSQSSVFRGGRGIDGPPSELHGLGYQSTQSSPKSIADDEAVSNHPNYRVRLWLLAISIFSSALISICATFALVQYSRFGLRNLADNVGQLDRAEDKLRMDLKRVETKLKLLENELKSLRAASSDAPPKKLDPKVIPLSNREREQPEKPHPAGPSK